MNALLNLVFRTIIRGAIYRWIFRLPKPVLIMAVCIAVVGFVMVQK